MPGKWNDLSRRVMLSRMAAAPVLGGALLPSVAQAQTTSPTGGYSFADCGDFFFNINNDKSCRDIRKMQNAAVINFNPVQIP